MEKYLVDAENRICKIIEVVYEELKSGSTTYRELERKIVKHTAEIGWASPRYATFICGELQEMLKTEQGELTVKQPAPYVK